MANKLVWEHPSSGNLVLCHPNYTGADRARFASDEDFIQWLLDEHLPEKNPFYNPQSPPQQVQESDWPTDHTFVDAWEWTGAISVNMPKARGIHMDRIREVRNEELSKLDLPFMRAVEAGDTDAQTTIGKAKQALRDLPITFDLTARTPGQLKNKWPTELPARTG